MSEIRQWPQCAECSSRYKGWWPVEAYSIEEQKGSGLRIHRVLLVKAECAHLGHIDGGLASTRGRDVQTARIEVPFWWGDQHVRDAIAALVFFRQGQAGAEHGMVTDVG